MRPDDLTPIDMMRAAIDLALEAMREDEIPVGAVVVRDGRIIGRGRNRRKIGRAPFAHAEMEAITEACSALGTWRLDGCSLYVTLEPCPMCAGAIVETRLARLVYGASDPRRGACGSLYDIPRDSRLHANVLSSGGLLAPECSELLRRFFNDRRRAARRRSADLL